jgi:hypothetical protein
MGYRKKRVKFSVAAVYPLILRSLASGVSKDEARASWFETARRASSP